MNKYEILANGHYINVVADYYSYNEEKLEFINEKTRISKPVAVFKMCTYVKEIKRVDD